MLDYEEISGEILKLESSRDTTYETIKRLAWLYTVRDHIYENSSSSQPIKLEVEGKTEFLNSVKGKDSVKIYNFIDKMVEEIKLLHPKMYRALIEKIQKIE